MSQHTLKNKTHQWVACIVFVTTTNLCFASMQSRKSAATSPKQGRLSLEIESAHTPSQLQVVKALSQVQKYGYISLIPLSVPDTQMELCMALGKYYGITVEKTRGCIGDVLISGPKGTINRIATKISRKLQRARDCAEKLRIQQRFAKGGSLPSGALVKTKCTIRILSNDVLEYCYALANFYGATIEQSAVNGTVVLQCCNKDIATFIQEQITEIIEESNKGPQ